MVWTVACIYFVALFLVQYGYRLILMGLKKRSPEEMRLFRAIFCSMVGSMLFLCVSAFCSLWKLTH